MIYFHRISLAFNHVIPLRMCYCTYVVDSWHKAIDACKFVVARFLHLAKPLTVSIMIILLDKLAHYGIAGNAHSWFESYLCGHQQAVKFDGNLSAWGSVRVCVPQGSILGASIVLYFYE